LYVGADGTAALNVAPKGIQSLWVFARMKVGHPKDIQVRRSRSQRVQAQGAFRIIDAFFGFSGAQEYRGMVDGDVGIVGLYLDCLA
jgi:hypothetical protein